MPELTAGTLRTVTPLGPQRLGGIFKDVPTLLEGGVDCKIGMWRPYRACRHKVLREGVLERTLAAATATEEWQAELTKKYWANTYMAGVQERTFLDEERVLMTSALGEIGLLTGSKGVSST